MHTMRFVTFFVGTAIIVMVQQGSLAVAKPKSIIEVPCIPATSGTGPAPGGVTALTPGPPPMAVIVNRQSSEEEQWNSTALEGCAKLKSLITPGNSKLLGFDTAQDALLTHILIPPFDIYTIGIDKLRAYQPGDPVTPLIKQLASRLYPLSVRGIVRSSLVVSRVGGTGTLTTTAWGLEKLITLVMMYKERDSDFVVWIPALNLHFLGDHPDESLMLKPLATRTLYGLTEGKPVHAAVVFALLAQQAREHDENSPG